MTKTEDVNLTRIMRRDGITSITARPHGFSVYMAGDICGTGETVGEAYDSAMRQKAAANAVQVAA